MLSFPFPLAKQVLPFTRPLVVAGSVAIPAAVGGWITIRESILTGFRGWITAYGFTVRTPIGYDYQGSLAFSIYLNDAPFNDNNGGFWTDERGTVASPLPSLVQIPLDVKITIQARRVIADILPAVVSGIVTGFMYPASVKTVIEDDGEKRV